MASTLNLLFDFGRSIRAGTHGSSASATMASSGRTAGVSSFARYDHGDRAQRVDLDSQLAEMIALRAEGKIGGIGISSVNIAQLRQALPAGIACVQNAYSLLDRAGEPLLDLCREHDIAWVPYFPLGSAFAGAAKVTDHRAVRADAVAQGATPAQVGLAWLLAHDPHILPIPGTSSLRHLDENVAAANVRLDAATLAVLDAFAAAGERR